jgi:hypothetical protein
VAVASVRFRVSVLAAALLFALGCEKKGAGGPPTGAPADTTCLSLYQRSDSLADALAFIEVPGDRLTSSLASVSKRGELANLRQLAFANRLFSLRQSKDVELFKSLLSDGTRKQLDEPDNNRQMVRYRLREVENGTFLYGQADCKFFATFRALTPADLDLLGRSTSFVEIPTHVIIFYQFHKPKTMLIGTCFHLIQDADSFRVVMETLSMGEFPSVGEE